MAGIFITLGVFGLMLLIIRLMQVKLSLHPEIPRKLLHVGMGALVLTFPWLFQQNWPVIVLAALAIVPLCLLRFTSLHQTLGQVTGAVQRVSLGEMYYPIAAATVFTLSAGDKLLFVIPMMILTVADAAAALIGVAYGKVKFITSDGLKSIEGSIAFFAIAFLSVHVPLLLFTSVGRAETLCIAIIIGLLAMLLEAIAWRGMDNLLVPLGTFALLSLYMDLSANALLLRLLFTLALVIFAVSCRFRSSLDDSSLIAAGLFGYMALMIGGWLYLVAPGIFFLLHLLFFPQYFKVRDTTVHSVLAVISVPLICLLLRVKTGNPVLFWTYSSAFAMHFAFVWLSFRVDAKTSVIAARKEVLRGTAVSWGAIALVSLVTGACARLEYIHGQTIPMLVGATVSTFTATSIAGILFFRALPWLYDENSTDRRVQWFGGLLSAVASLILWLILLLMLHPVIQK